ncbi:prepilin-type N-terminal cleavage/methylation domain-containing protein [Rhodanobacter sp. C01]|uniref:PilW family protein n=1 Tax=Rhodanobacter sp. C01 TaxID=1945856 RepID=UPI000986A62A|nr:prepilin-type N-terminal cleavage/methylation domain-containing protein [Rhodanobacter sp. C01]OOG50293.1 prepilin-type N-terminal cleavage/methylation domain-containing protein [Rhodanobacter sp. C01]
MNHGRRQQHAPWPVRSSAGFTLIELMVAMLLGLIVIGGVVSVFLANQRSYRTNQALSDVQDSSRVAFEMMARDIRNAGLTGCSNSGRVANVLNNRSTAWWANWSNTLMGYGAGQTDLAVTTGAGAGQRASGTDSLMLLGADSSGVSVKNNAEPAATFTINETSSNLQAGDVIIVCDPDHAAIVQITGYANGTITHAASGSPGNCTTDLNYPTVCSSESSYVFAPNAQIAKLTAADWYIGNYVDGNGVSGKSLYRMDATNTAQEMVRDVTGMSITYHQSGNNSFVGASDPLLTNWALVDAVQVNLTVESTDKHAGIDVKPLSRKFTATTTVRNRVN